jgi:hypothetical protein
LLQQVNYFVSREAKTKSKGWLQLIPGDRFLPDANFIVEFGHRQAQVEQESQLGSVLGFEIENFETDVISSFDAQVSLQEDQAQQYCESDYQWCDGRGNLASSHTNAGHGTGPAIRVCGYVRPPVYDLGFVNRIFGKYLFRLRSHAISGLRIANCESKAESTLQLARVRIANPQSAIPNPQFLGFSIHPIVADTDVSNQWYVELNSRFHLTL